MISITKFFVAPLTKVLNPIGRAISTPMKLQAVFKAYWKLLCDHSPRVTGITGKTTNSKLNSFFRSKGKVVSAPLKSTKPFTSITPKHASGASHQVSVNPQQATAFITPATRGASIDVDSTTPLGTNNDRCRSMNTLGYTITHKNTSSTPTPEQLEFQAYEEQLKLGAYEEEPQFHFFEEQPQFNFANCEAQFKIFGQPNFLICGQYISPPAFNASAHTFGERVEYHLYGSPKTEAQFKFQNHRIFQFVIRVGALCESKSEEFVFLAGFSLLCIIPSMYFLGSVPKATNRSGRLCILATMPSLLTFALGIIGYLWFLLKEHVTVGFIEDRVQEIQCTLPILLVLYFCRWLVSSETIKEAIKTIRSPIGFYRNLNCPSDPVEEEIKTRADAEVQELYNDILDDLLYDPAAYLIGGYLSPAITEDCMSSTSILNQAASNTETSMNGYSTGMAALTVCTNDLQTLELSTSSVIDTHYYFAEHSVSAASPFNSVIIRRDVSPVQLEPIPTTTTTTTTLEHPPLLEVLKHTKDTQQDLNHHHYGLVIEPTKPPVPQPSSVSDMPIPASSQNSVNPHQFDCEMPECTGNHSDLIKECIQESLGIFDDMNRLISRVHYSEIQEAVSEEEDEFLTRILELQATSHKTIAKSLLSSLNKRSNALVSNFIESQKLRIQQDRQVRELMRESYLSQLEGIASNFQESLKLLPTEDLQESSTASNTNFHETHVRITQEGHYAALKSLETYGIWNEIISVTYQEIQTDHQAIIRGLESDFIGYVKQAFKAQEIKQKH